MELETKIMKSKVRFTSIIQEIEDRISGTKEKIEEMGTSIKKHVKSKTPRHKLSMKYGAI